MNPTEVSPADYHSTLTCDRSNILSPDSWLSKSALWELANTSLYEWRYHPKQFKDTDAMRWGSIIDCLTTTPELFEESIVISPYDAYRSNEAKEWKREQLKAGLLIVTPDELEAAKRAAFNLLTRHSESAEIFAKSKKQVIIAAKLAGVNIKGLLDLVPTGERYLADLKTTVDLSSDAISKTCTKFGYHMQGGLYLALWNIMFPDDRRDSFVHVWQKSKLKTQSFAEASYEVRVTEMPQADLESGEQYAFHLINRVKAATEADHWPMLGEGVPREVITRATWGSIQEEAKIKEDNQQELVPQAVDGGLF